MALINAYIYDYLGAINAINILNDHHGLPVSGGITQFSIDSFTELNGQYYIPYDDEWTSILGTPTQINTIDGEF